MALDALSRFARLLGLPAHQAEDALHSERAARAVLSRRSFFAASGAMVAGTGFSFGPAPTANWVDRIGLLYGMKRLPGELDDEYRRRMADKWTRLPPNANPKISGPEYTWQNIEIRINQKLVLPVTEIEWT